MLRKYETELSILLTKSKRHIKKGQINMSLKTLLFRHELFCILQLESFPK